MPKKVQVKCDVIVLSWNRRDLTKSFVESFLSSTITPTRLIIIDNDSSDNTPEHLESLRDTDNCKFQVILNKENIGFVRGMNQGIAFSDAPYVCLANNDLIFNKGWLEEIINIFEKYPEVGLLSPNSNNLGAPKPAPDEKGVFAELPFVVGFCMVIKREVIDKVGALSDEFYPMFFEDSDYSLKAVKAGYRIGVARGSFVWHEEHASWETQAREKEAIFRKNRDTFNKKWGKIQRIAWVVNNADEVITNLSRAVEISREGNYLWFMVKGENLNRPEIFKKAGLIEHCGINFIRYNNKLDLWWKILKKKKKYDKIIWEGEQNA